MNESLLRCASRTASINLKANRFKGVFVSKEHSGAFLAGPNGAQHPIKATSFSLLQSSLFSPTFWKHLLSFDVQWRIPIQTIHQTLHPSDSGVYDKNGQ